MRKYDPRVVEVHKKILVEVSCDWCGRHLASETEVSEHMLSSDIVNDESFECSFTVALGTGIYMSVGGWEIDELCKECVDKLRDLLVEQGITLTTVNA